MGRGEGRDWAVTERECAGEGLRWISTVSEVLFAGLGTLGMGEKEGVGGVGSA